MKLRKRSVGILAAIALLSITGCSEQENSETELNTQLIAEIKADGHDDCKLYQDIESNKVYEMHDNDVVNTYKTTQELRDGDLLFLSDTEEAQDITIREQKYKDTWLASIEESTKYINYLKGKAFKIIREVDTQEYIDVVMQSENTSDTIRLIITPDKLITSAVKYSELNIKDYIKD